MEWARSAVHAVGRIGAHFVYLALIGAILLAASYAGFFLYQKTDKRWLGWAAGLLVAITMYMMFGSAIFAVQRVSCMGDADYQACMDDDDSN